MTKCLLFQDFFFLKISRKIEENVYKKKYYEKKKKTFFIYTFFQYLVYEIFKFNFYDISKSPKEAES